MKDLAWIKARCREDGDCWLWTMTVNDSGCPRYSTHVGGRPTSFQPRRIAWQLGNPGKTLGRGLVGTSCGNPRCLNPEHLVKRTKGEVISLMSTNPATRAKKMAAAVRRRGLSTKLDMEKARYIRSSTKTLAVVAGELGISIALASKIRRGELWKEHSNPFAGLVAANDSSRRAA